MKKKKQKALQIGRSNTREDGHECEYQKSKNKKQNTIKYGQLFCD
jgi:hypothetical protein